MSSAALSKSRKVSVLSDQDWKVGAKSADFAENGTFRQESRVWKWRFCAGIPHPKAQSGPQKPKRQWIRFLGLRKAARPAANTAPTALRSEPTFRLSASGICKRSLPPAECRCFGDGVGASAVGRIHTTKGGLQMQSPWLTCVRVLCLSVHSIIFSPVHGTNNIYHPL